MASAFIFLTKFFLIFVINQRVNADEQHGNCEVNETTGVIMKNSLKESYTNLNCSSGGSQKAVKISVLGGSQPNRDDKNWKALTCKVAGSGPGSNATFCVHGPNDPPTISGTNALVSGVPAILKCTITDVYPGPRIEWHLRSLNTTVNISVHTTYDNNTSLFSATSSLSFTPKLENDGRLLTCSVLPPVLNVWTPLNSSVELSVTDESNKSAVVQVDEATSSSLYISWQLSEGDLSGSSMLTLRYCQNSTEDLDNVEMLDNLSCPKEVTGLNGTSYNLTELEPFEWYAIILLANGNTVASAIASTAPLSPEYYGVYMTFSPEKEILEISRLPMTNRTVPSDLCFELIQNEGSTPNCASPSLKCFDPGSKIDDFKAEDIPGIGLVSSGRGLCSHPPLYTPIILNSPGGMMDMPHVSIVMTAVIGTSVFILLSTVALLLFLNFICKGIGCLGKKDKDIDEDETLVQVIRKDNSRKVDKDGLVYVDIAHEKSHPADAPPIRTEEPTVYALVETGVMGSCKKDDDGLVYVEVSHEHDHPAGAPPIQTEKPTVYATLDMEAMASLKEGKEEMGGAKDGEEGGTDKKESVKEKKKSVKEENKDLKDDKEGAKEEKEVIEKKKGSVKEKKKSVKKESKDVKDDKEGVKEEKEKVEKEKEGGEKAPEDKSSPVDKKPNYENITFTDDGLAITLETHL